MINPEAPKYVFITVILSSSSLHAQERKKAVREKAVFCILQD